MHDAEASNVVIVDLGIGNLFSIARACEVVGLKPVVSSDSLTIQRSDALILPGVGAFAGAMQNLRDSDLMTLLSEYRDSGRPMLGICLGMQLLMEYSEEFGEHQGLGFIKGGVTSLCGQVDAKLPHVGWSPVFNHKWESLWRSTLLNQFCNDDYQYFLHSFVASPEDETDVLAYSRYEDFDFAAVINKGNITGCQFHPEKSGSAGLMIYRQWAAQHGLSLKEKCSTLEVNN